MLIQPRHFRNLGFHLPRLASYVRGWRKMKQHAERFGSIPQVVVVGAAGGGLDKWRPWAMLGLVNGYGFEPDPVECERLRKAFPFAEFHPFALGEQTRVADFYMTNSPQCASCLEPDLDALAPYSVAHGFIFEKTGKVPLRRFDDLCNEGVLPAPHFLQIDVQGYEYEVLQGFGNYLDGLLGVELESHVTRLYKGEKSLWEVIDFMKSRGFVLRHIEPQGSFGGELVEVNAFFSRLLKPDQSEQSSLIKLWELVYGLPHYDGGREGLF